MVSRPDSRAETAALHDVLLQLRSGKVALHQRHSRLPLPEKVRLVMELQRIAAPMIARQRPLRSWEHPWEIEP